MRLIITLFRCSPQATSIPRTARQKRNPRNRRSASPSALENGRFPLSFRQATNKKSFIRTVTERAPHAGIDAFSSQNAVSSSARAGDCRFAESIAATAIPPSVVEIDAANWEFLGHQAHARPPHVESARHELELAAVARIGALTCSELAEKESQQRRPYVTPEWRWALSIRLAEKTRRAPGRR